MCGLSILAFGTSLRKRQTALRFDQQTGCSKIFIGYNFLIVPSRFQ